MFVLRPPLTEDLVRELSEWQVQFYLGQGDRYQGTLNRLELRRSGNRSLLVGKLSQLLGSLRRGPWQKDAKLELDGQILPKEEFVIGIRKSTSVTLLENSSCAIHTPGRELIVVFFSPENYNWMKLRKPRRTSKVSVKPVLPVAAPIKAIAKTNGHPVSDPYDRRPLDVGDWEQIEAALLVEVHNPSQAHRDLRRFKQLGFLGSVPVGEFFPEVLKLYKNPSPYYALPLRSRVNAFFERVGLPHRIRVSVISKQSPDYRIRLVRLRVSDSKSFEKE